MSINRSVEGKLASKAIPVLQSSTTSTKYVVFHRRKIDFNERYEKYNFPVEDHTYINLQYKLLHRYIFYELS